jgi:hypothetical protein
MRPIAWKAELCNVCAEIDQMGKKDMHRPPPPERKIDWEHLEELACKKAWRLKFKINA